MTNKNVESDNWGQLLSDFGIEDKMEEHAPQPDVPQPEESKRMMPPEPTAPPTGLMATPEKSNDTDGFGAGLIDSGRETSEETLKPKEKKSIFSRFPKINFFGAPPEVSLDSVMEGATSPSLGGKAFIDNKLEKMPISQERIDRQKNRQEQEVKTAPDAWSAVVSQIDVLASGGDAKTKTEKHAAKRAVSSMFDDPVPESEEFRKCKDLMGEESRRREMQKDTVHEEERDSLQYDSQQRRRGRGSRYQPPAVVDDLPESDFEPIEDEMPATRGRGRRGSRYSESGYRGRERVRDNLPQEEWSEVDAALQADTGRSEPVQRGGRRQRYDEPRHDEQRHGEQRHSEQRSDRRRRPERVDEPAAYREPLDREPLDREPPDRESLDRDSLDRGSLDRGDDAVIARHDNIPSWDEAIHDTIMSNIARHKAHSGGAHSGGHSGRGRR